MYVSVLIKTILFKRHLCWYWHESPRKLPLLLIALPNFLSSKTIDCYCQNFLSHIRFVQKFQSLSDKVSTISFQVYFHTYQHIVFKPLIRFHHWILLQTVNVQLVSIPNKKKSRNKLKKVCHAFSKFNFKNIKSVKWYHQFCSGLFFVFFYSCIEMSF